MIINMRAKLTIFTPTFNRAYILPKLYDSLKMQTSKRFMWLIIDDGSQDDTANLVEKWIDENIITINYYKQKNGGKHRAYNKAIELCTTDYLMCCDSDDYLVENAVEILEKSYDKLVDNVCGIITYRLGKEGKTSNGKVFPKKTYAKVYELMKRDHFETCMVHRTDIIKNFKFPEIPGENFISENYMWRQIDQDYIYYVIPKGLMILQYQDDGLTKNENIYKNVIGKTLYYEQEFRLSKRFIDKLYNIAFYFFYQEKSKLKICSMPIYFSLTGKILSFYLNAKYSKKIR